MQEKNQSAFELIVETVLIWAPYNLLNSKKLYLFLT